MRNLLEMVVTLNFIKELSKMIFSHCMCWVGSEFKFCKQSTFSNIFLLCFLFFCISFFSFVFCGLNFLKKINCSRTKDFFSACCSCDLFTLKIKAYFKLLSWHLQSLWRVVNLNRNIIMRMFGWRIVCVCHMSW